MACPICKSDHFYVKDPDDEFETYEFQVQKEGLDFQDPDQKELASPLVATGEIYCSRCSWHGLKKQIE
jgi:hypothetical protein